MAERFLITNVLKKEDAIPELQIKKIERNQKLKEMKKIAIERRLKATKLMRSALKMRTHKYEEEYQKMRNQLIKAKRTAKAKDGYYKEADAKVLLVVRIRGINKVPPKPRMIMRLFRLIQLHSCVLLKVNKATTEMLKCINPYVTYGVPTLKMIRELVYKRGYAKIGRKGCKQRIRITNNQMIKENLGQYGIVGMEDIIHELYTCGPNFKQVNNFLWPFKLSSPKKGFVAKRHGYAECKGGDWGNREGQINKLVERMN